MALLDTLRYLTWTLQLSRDGRRGPDEVRALQERRLRRLLRHAAKHAPFYRDKYRGLDLDRCALADLPPTNKGELMANFDAAVTDPNVRRSDVEAFVDEPSNVGRLFRGRYAVSHTSGSQGQPMLILQEPWNLELMFACQMTRGNSFRKVGVLNGLRAILRPVRLAYVGMKQGFYPSAATFTYMPAACRTFVKVEWLSLGDGDLIERLNAFRPDVLTAYATVLETLALQADRLRLAPDLKQVVNNSEVLTPQARARAEAAFGVPVLDNYASGECLFLTNGCPKGPGQHVNADWAILEVVDEHNRPVPPGELGAKVLVTNLANRAQPYIRYEIGDRVEMAAGPCACGRTLPKVARIEGRASDAFWIRDGKGGYRRLLGSVFKNAMDYLREVREWQAVQYERNKVRLNLELLPGATLDEAKAWRVLRHQLELFNVEDLLDVQLARVPELTSDPATGKFRRMVSYAGTPADLPEGAALRRAG